MPVKVSPEEAQGFPTFIRAGTVSKFADALNYLVELLKDPKRRDKEAVKFTVEDGVTVDKWGTMATALRAAGKKVKDEENPQGHQVTVVYRDEPKEGGKKDETTPVLWVKRSGPFVPMSEEEKASRKATAEANKAAKEALAAQAEEAGQQEAAEKQQAQRSGRK